MLSAALALAAAALLAAGPSPDSAIPTRPGPLAQRLTTADRALRVELGRWDAAQPPPEAVTLWSLDLQRAVRVLSRRPSLAAATTRRLGPRLAYAVRLEAGALRDLRRLSAGWPKHRVRTGRPEPLATLSSYYREAERRFRVGRHVLAAVNLVESQFGRLRNDSVAGAQGPMQFMPPTWRAYGLGGDVDDPHDAILGAANLLRHGGAPSDYGRALYAYNPSPLYVRAVLRYARLVARDPAGLPALYTRQVYAGGRRLTGPGR